MKNINIFIFKALEYLWRNDIKLKSGFEFGDCIRKNYFLGMELGADFNSCNLDCHCWKYFCNSIEEYYSKYLEWIDQTGPEPLIIINSREIPKIILNTYFKSIKIEMNILKSAIKCLVI